MRSSGEVPLPHLASRQACRNDARKGCPQPQVWKAPRCQFMFAPINWLLVCVCGITTLDGSASAS
eukprot:357089-Chlamydomonas_euryale.AAC.3